VLFKKGYGLADVARGAAFTPDTKSRIGSITKQFTASAILKLQEQGKLSVQDKLSKYFPDFPRGDEVTLHHLLTHTSGIRSYTDKPGFMDKVASPVGPEDLIKSFQNDAYDFDPGKKWHYDNSGYLLLGRVIERVSGQSYGDFLSKTFFEPLGMTNTGVHRAGLALDHEALGDSDAKGYTRFGHGPIRPVQPEAPGWLFGAGELAMTARDLALWDLGLIEGKLLKPALMDEMIKPVFLKNGSPTDYALGIGISNSDGHPRLQHGGAVSGYVSSNTVWLDQGAAVVAFSNLDGSSAPGSITRQIGPLLLAETADPQAAPQLEQARRIFSQLQGGTIDRSLLTSDANFYFTPQVLADAASSLKPLGVSESFEQTGMGLRGGMTWRSFQIKFSGGTVLRLSTFSVDDGKFAQYLIQ
jgi:CubicO group peptidase (beta-lactamase class C family)